jgi:lysophospholipase L1-like esterase
MAGRRRHTDRRTPQPASAPRPGWTRRAALGAMVLTPELLSLAATQDAGSGRQWVGTWTASAHGPYPSGNPAAQPVLDFAFPVPLEGAVDQTFRLAIRPDLWGPTIRLRFANTFGTRPVTLADVFVGLQGSGGNVVAGTNTKVAFAGGNAVTVAAGASNYSDPVALGFVTADGGAVLQGRRLLVSFHVPGTTGPMTWHAKALTTSYLSAPKAGSHGAEERDQRFPYTTTSWFFLDAVDVAAAAGTRAIVCFGDSITDGTGSTLNGDDRWPDVLSRRLHAELGSRVAVVNAGIGGNRVTGPPDYTTATPFAGGPSALDRLERDVLSVPGLSAVVWLEGINDLSSGASADAVIAGLREGVRRIKAKNLRVIGATITSSVGANGAAGTADVEARRQAVNTFIRTAGVFDGVADFDAATRDGQTGTLRAAFQPNSTTGGPGDHLHPNRAGYQAMGEAIDLGLLTGRTGA